MNRRPGRPEKESGLPHSWLFVSIRGSTTRSDSEVEPRNTRNTRKLKAAECVNETHSDQPPDLRHPSDLWLKTLQSVFPQETWMLPTEGTENLRTKGLKDEGTNGPRDQGPRPRQRTASRARVIRVHPCASVVKTRRSDSGLDNDVVFF